MNFSELDFTFDGSINLILGPMFSGKSTELKRRVDRFTIAKKHVALIAYVKDTRYSNGLSIVTHDRASCRATFATETILPLIPQIIEGKYDVVAIDEGQFFGDVVRAAELLAALGINVHIAALSGTFDQHDFPSGIHRLIPKAESVKMLKSVCHFCGEDRAPYSVRISEQVGVEVIGGVNEYRAACRHCFMANSNACTRNGIIDGITETLREVAALDHAVVAVGVSPSPACPEALPGCARCAPENDDEEDSLETYSRIRA